MRLHLPSICICSSLLPGDSEAWQRGCNCWDQQPKQPTHRWDGSYIKRNTEPLKLSEDTLMQFLDMFSTWCWNLGNCQSATAKGRRSVKPPLMNYSKCSHHCCNVQEGKWSFVDKIGRNSMSKNNSKSPGRKSCECRACSRQWKKEWVAHQHKSVCCRQDKQPGIWVQKKQRNLTWVRIMREEHRRLPAWINDTHDSTPRSMQAANPMIRAAEWMLHWTASLRMALIQQTGSSCVGAVREVTRPVHQT